jgi:hypothetical protein
LTGLDLNLNKIRPVNLWSKVPGFGNDWTHGI